MVKELLNANPRNEHDKQGRTFQNTVKHSGLETDIRHFLPE